MIDALTPEDASPIVGVPAEQLKRWAWFKLGPPNVGTRFNPKYLEDDLRTWISAARNHSSKRLAS